MYKDKNKKIINTGNWGGGGGGKPRDSAFPREHARVWCELATRI